MNTNIIKNEEKIIFELRSLYAQSGYTRYTMSKFEEYDLYVRNKDFLISDSVITFTDTNGKLMALKPDVTLSIVKNNRDIPGSVQKVYYDENVYRVSRGTRSFRELKQVGLECIGDVDDYCIYEVISLAAKSLKRLSDEAVLNISHLGVLSELLADVSGDDRSRILSCIGERNLHELSRACEGANLSEDTASMLKLLIRSYGAPGQVLPALTARMPRSEALAQLIRITDAFRGTDIEAMLRIDFSAANDVNYYNGFAFKGFIDGVPESVLSGGQYDQLMKKMNRKSRAIGFAVYLDLLERLNRSENAYDVDVVLIYDDSCDMQALRAAAEKFNAEGKSVLVQKCMPDKLRCRQVAGFTDGEVKLLAENA